MYLNMWLIFINSINSVIYRIAITVKLLKKLCIQIKQTYKCSKKSLHGGMARL